MENKIKRLKRRNLLFNKSKFITGYSPNKIFQNFSAFDYLELVNSNVGLIKHSKFIAPKLGDNNFGYFKVELEYGY